MGTSKLVNANKKLEEKVTGTFGAIQDRVVSGYTKLEDAFVGRYLTRDGESVEEAKARLKRELSEAKQ